MADLGTVAGRFPGPDADAEQPAVGRGHAVVTGTPRRGRVYRSGQADLRVAPGLHTGTGRSGVNGSEPAS